MINPLVLIIQFYLLVIIVQFHLFALQLINHCSKNNSIVLLVGLPYRALQLLLLNITIILHFFATGCHPNCSNNKSSCNVHKI